MNVVVRSLMAAGLFMYAGIHVVQAFSPPDGAPLWLQIAFFLTAALAVVLGGGLLLRPPGDNEAWKDLAAALALGSLIALVLSATTGFAGVDQADLRASTFGVAVAEFMVLVSWAVGRLTGHRYDEVEA